MRILIFSWIFWEAKDSSTLLTEHIFWHPQSIMDDLMDKINLWGSDDINDYESEVNEDATTEATVLTTKIPTTPDQDSSGDEAGLAFNAILCCFL